MFLQVLATYFLNSHFVPKRWVTLLSLADLHLEPGIIDIWIRSSPWSSIHRYSLSHSLNLPGSNCHFFILWRISSFGRYFVPHAPTFWIRFLLRVFIMMVRNLYTIDRGSLGGSLGSISECCKAVFSNWQLERELVTEDDLAAETGLTIKILQWNWHII